MASESMVKRCVNEDSIKLFNKLCNTGYISFGKLILSSLQNFRAINLINLQLIRETDAPILSWYTVNKEKLNQNMFSHLFTFAISLGIVHQII